MNEPPYQLVATEITCIECRRLWSVPSERWRVYLTENDPREPVAYCAECAEREFE